MAFLNLIKGSSKLRSPYEIKVLVPQAFFFKHSPEAVHILRGQRPLFLNEVALNTRNNI